MDGHDLHLLCEPLVMPMLFDAPNTYKPFATLFRHAHVMPLFFVLCFFALAGCDRRQEAPAATQQVVDAGPPSGLATGAGDPDAAADQDEVSSGAARASLDALLISSKGDPALNRSLEDFQKHVRQLMLFAPNDVLQKGERHIPDSRLRRPIVQSSMLKALLEQVMVERAARERGLEANFQEIEERISRDPSLSRFARELPPSPDDPTKEPPPANTGAPRLEEFGLSVTDLHEVARHHILREKLEVALAREVDRKQVERSYRQAHDRVRMLWVKVSNTPLTSEIDAFLEDETNLASIQDHYASHTGDFRSPAIVVADLLVVPEEDAALRDRERVALLKAAREDLAGGASFEEVAARHKLTPRPSQSIVLKEDGRLHNAAIGETGVSIQAPRGDYVWIVREKIPSKQLELDRPLRREIASLLMRRHDRVPGANEAADIARDTLAAIPAARLEGADVKALAREVEKKLDERLAGKVRFKVVPGDWIERHPDGFFVGIGTSPELMQQVFSLEEPGHTLERPVTIDQYLWTGIMVGREKPDMDGFEERYEEIRGQYLEAMQGHLVEMMFPRWQDDLGLVLDRGPLTAHYGREEKKRR